MAPEPAARPSARSRPARQQGWTPLHETGPTRPDRATDFDSGDGRVVETGTTVVGLVAGKTVVLAADRRASVGGGRFVTNKRVRKVEPVHPTAAVALSGAVGHIQHFVRTLRAETRLYADRRDDPMSLTALATLAGNVLRSAPLRVSPILGGVDAEGEGPRVYGFDGGGGVLPDAYAAGGSGMQVAYGVLERQYETGLSPQEARGVAARAVDAAGERDTASGDGLAVTTVTGDGIDVEEFDAPADADREVA
jgi:proteasome beta subunit